MRFLAVSDVYFYEKDHFAKISSESLKTIIVSFIYILLYVFRVFHFHRDPSPCARPPPPQTQTECTPRPAIRRQSTTEEILISRGFRRQSTTEEMIRCRNFRRQSSQSDDTCR